MGFSFKNLDPRRVGRNFKRKVEGAGGDLKNTIKREIIDEIKKDLINPLEKKVGRVDDIIEAKFKRLGAELENNITKKLYREVVEPLKREVEQAANKIKAEVEMWLKTAAAALATEILKEVARWARIFLPSQASLGLGFIGFGFDMEEKYDQFQGIISRPPKGRGGVVRVIETLAPTNIMLSGSFQVAFVFGSIKELGVSAGMTVPTQRFIRRIGEVL